MNNLIKTLLLISIFCLIGYSNDTESQLKKHVIERYKNIHSIPESPQPEAKIIYKLSSHEERSKVINQTLYTNLANNWTEAFKSLGHININIKVLLGDSIQTYKNVNRIEAIGSLLIVSYSPNIRKTL